MTIEYQNLRLQLIEAQMTILQYQHKDVQASLAQLKDLQVQAAFDEAADVRDVRSGATAPADE